MNNLMRWNRPQHGLDRLSSLRDEIDRLFEAPLAELARFNPLLTSWGPAVDMHEDKDNFYVNVELPGMKKEEIDLQLHDRTLSISGERRKESKEGEAELYRSERFFGRFQRTIGLPAPVDTARIKAQYRDGILSVTLPKTEEAKPKQIDVRVG